MAVKINNTQLYTDVRVIKADTPQELEKQIHNELFKTWEENDLKNEQIVITIENTQATITRSTDSSKFLFVDSFQESRIESMLDILNNSEKEY